MVTSPALPVYFLRLESWCDQPQRLWMRRRRRGMPHLPITKWERYRGGASVLTTLGVFLLLRRSRDTLFSVVPSESLGNRSPALWQAPSAMIYPPGPREGSTTFSPLHTRCCGLFCTCPAWPDEDAGPRGGVCIAHVSTLPSLFFFHSAFS